MDSLPLLFNDNRTLLHYVPFYESCHEPYISHTFFYLGISFWQFDSYELPETDTKKRELGVSKCLINPFFFYW